MVDRIPMIIRKLYPKYGLNKSDIIFGTFPKSGTTWFRFIIANIICLNELDGLPVDYKVLNEDLNSAFEPNWRSKIMYNSLPQFRSTHLNYRNLMFQNNKSVHLYRNPKDTMVSYFHYRKSFIKNGYNGEFENFIRHHLWGIETWCKHFKSWETKSTISISFEELKKDTFTTMRKVLNELEIKNIDDIILKEAIKRSDFKVIKLMEKESGRDIRSVRKHKKDFQFARSGKINKGGDYFSKKDELYLNTILNKYNLKEQFL